MKKHFTLPKVLLSSITVAACQASTQKAKKLPRELQCEIIQNVNGLYNLKKMMAVSRVFGSYAEVKKDKEYYKLVQTYIDRYKTQYRLRDWPTDPKELAAAAEALETNRTITEIYLSNNNIGDQRAASLAEALKTNRTITEIYLSNNNIGDQGAASLAEALKTNRTITLVWLASNNIGDQGAASLAEALKTNPTIREIYLYYNNIGEEAERNLAQVAVNKNIRIGMYNQ